MYVSVHLLQCAYLFPPHGLVAAKMWSTVLEGQEEELKAIKVNTAASEEDFECEAEV